jgi:hypothetical protein
MAHPYRWVDEIVRAGWLAVLSGTAVKLLWAVGKFYDRASGNARADGITLQRLAGIGRTAFYEARDELEAADLIEIKGGALKGKYREYRVHIYCLAQPLPTVPPGYRVRRRRQHTSANADPYSSRVRPHTRKKSSLRTDLTVRQDGQHDSQDPHNKRLTALPPSIDSNQLGNREVQETERIVRQCLPAAPPQALSMVNQWVAAVARAPSARDRRVNEAVGAVSEKFNLPAAAVREAVEHGAAVLHPFVQQAIEVFDGRVVEVRRIDS